MRTATGARRSVASIRVTLRALLWTLLSFATASLTACQFNAFGIGGVSADLASNNVHGCACQCVASQAVPVTVGVGADDAEELADGSIVLVDSNLPLAQDEADPTLVGLRFDGLDLSEDAVVEQVYVQFTSGLGNDPPGLAFALGVGAGGNDAVELNDNSVVLGGTGLSFQTGNLVALRFSAVGVPPDVTVVSAHVQFEAGGDVGRRGDDLDPW